MTGITTRGRGHCAYALAALVLLNGSDARAEDLPGPSARVRIGLTDSLLQDVPEALLTSMQEPFNRVMAQQTGLNGQLVHAGDADDLARQLAEDKVQLGIFSGIDFARARQKHPELKPLMICVNKHPELRAKLVVCTDSKATGFADLGGQTLAVPRLSPPHCRAYLEDLYGTQGSASGEVAAKVLRVKDFEEALDRVVNGTAKAAVIDRTALECYQRLKPGRFAWLKVLDQSPAFPCACVAYHPRTGLSPATLGRFRKGMANANQTYLGKRMFSLFRVTAFEPVPPGYEKGLAEIVKAYPPPVRLAAERSGSTGRVRSVGR